MTTNNPDEEERTFVIAGVNGDIGQEFAKRLVDHGRLYGISRNPNKSSLNYAHICVDLLKSENATSAFNKINPTENLVYVHLLGKFKFEDKNHPITDKNSDGIDDDIFETNVTTFRNVAPILIDYLKKRPRAKLKLVAIGSTSDLYKIPFWQSFTHAKNELRKEFRWLYGHPENFGRVSTLFIDVSTVAGTQLAGERPFISKDFCLTPKDIVEQALPYLLDDRQSCLEMSVIKPNPAFFDANYLVNHKTKARWYQDMYGDSQKRRLKGSNEQDEQRTI